MNHASQQSPYEHARHMAGLAWFIRTVAASLLLSLVLDAIVFNLPFWHSRMLQPQEASLTYGPGITENTGDLQLTAAQDAYLEVTSNDGSSIEYLYLGGEDTSANEIVTFSVATHPEGTGGWFSGSDRTLSGGVDRSRYLRVGGSATAARITFKGAVGARLPIKSVTINPRVPYSVSPMRIAILFLLAIGIAILRPGSPIYQVRLDLRQKSQLAGLATLTCLCALVIFFVWWLPDGLAAFRGTFHSDGATHWIDNDQYARLADALLHGRVDLDLPVDPNLAALPNPYDIAARDQLGLSGGQIFWDHAFYEGRYYCYFGVVPAVLAYLPFQVVTGRWLPTGAAVLVFGLLSVAFISLFVIRFARVFHAGTASLGATMLAIVSVNVGCGYLYHVFSPAFYSIPGIASLALTMAGLWFWLGAKRGETVSRRHLVAGSLCLAANLGCRPQFIFSVFLAFPIFWEELTRSRLFFSRKGIGNTLAILLPFAVVFAPLLAYNYVRFGSLLDFGNDYNLTGFDLQKTNPPLQELPAALFYFLLQPLNITMQFPFLNLTSANYATWFPTEALAGGFFAMSPFLLVLFAYPKLFRGPSSTRRFMRICLPFAAITMVADALMSSVAWRYHLDFGYLLVIAFMAMLLQVDSELRECSTSGDETLLPAETQRRELGSWSSTASLVLSIACALLLVSVLCQFFLLFTVGRIGDLRTLQPERYFEIASWFTTLF